MISRKGVILLSFDISCQNPEERREYRKFIKFIKRKGFAFVLESVYVLLLKNSSTANREISEIKRQTPPNGQVMAVFLPLNAFEKMTLVNGNFDFSTFSDDTVFV